MRVVLLAARAVLLGLLWLLVPGILSTFVLTRGLDGVSWWSLIDKATSTHLLLILVLLEGRLHLARAIGDLITTLWRAARLGALLRLRADSFEHLKEQGLLSIVLLVLSE